MTDMNMRPNTTANFPGRTYRFYTGKPLYQFGHGLSYSTFYRFIKSGPTTVLVHLLPKMERTNIAYSKYPTRPNLNADNQAIDISAINCKNLSIDILIGVKNAGETDGTNVVLAFWKPPRSGVRGAPRMELVGFERVEVKRGKTEMVGMRLDVCRRISNVDEQGKRKLVMGLHTFVVGSSSEQQARHHVSFRLAEAESQAPQRIRHVA